MMLITHNGIVDLVESGVIENSDLSLVNPASLDIRLGFHMMREANNVKGRGIVSLADKMVPQMVDADMTGDGWLIFPGEFVLVDTMEIFHLPQDIAFEYKLKSSLARAGLNHSLAGWADPGFNNATLTLELQNVLQHHILKITPGMRIGQIVFWRGEPVPEDKSYANTGRYNGQRGATPSRGV